MSRYGELAAKVDAFFTRVHARHGDDMQCAAGCFDCCAPGLTITTAEADAVRALVATWDAARRAELAIEQRAGCAALDAGGRCRIYAARPIVCRSHGAPIRLREGRSLPVVQACAKNFRRTEADADCVLDQSTLSALVLAVNGGDTARIEIAELLAQLAR
jgi:Fe-S-cluster containining protein